MRLLLDTHLLLWAGAYPERLSSTALTLFEDRKNELIFSTASIWEVAIKFGRGRENFLVEPGEFRRELRANSFEELPVLGEHAVAVASLPHIHKDPFDRLLIAQSVVEGIVLLTSDAVIAKYGGLVRQV
jgi:PIN domain nuclease of toxin-antitoxin system